MRQRQYMKIQLTAINVVDNSLWDSTLFGNGNVLRFLVATLSAEASPIVHGSLECVIFPAEYVVAVLAVSSVITSAEDKRLRTILGSVLRVVEFGYVPII